MFPGDVLDSLERSDRIQFLSGRSIDPCGDILDDKTFAVLQWDNYMGRAYDAGGSFNTQWDKHHVFRRGAFANGESGYTEILTMLVQTLFNSLDFEKLITRNPDAVAFLWACLRGY